MKTILRYFANKTHDVRLQLLCASLFGLLELYGYSGAFAIILKARKLNKAKPRNRVTAKNGVTK
jgi:hypothetical protein